MTTTPAGHSLYANERFQLRSKPSVPGTVQGDQARSMEASRSLILCGPVPGSARRDHAFPTCRAQLSHSFHGDAVPAYRDPLVAWDSGIFWMFFTLNTHDPDGTPFWQAAYSTSTDLAHRSAALPITPRDRSVNFSSHESLVCRYGLWVLCLQTYPTPLAAIMIHASGPCAAVTFAIGTRPG